MDLFTNQKQTQRPNQKNLWIPKGMGRGRDKRRLGLIYTLMVKNPPAMQEL